MTAKASPLDKRAYLVLRYLPVGHSIFGATTFAVQTSEAWPAYTGDLQLHADGPVNTEHFMEEVRKLRALALLCEGTRAGDEKQVTEDEVCANAWREIGAARGLVVADFGPRDVERLLTFLRIARETERKLLVLGKNAHLLEATHVASPPGVPDIADCPDIMVSRDPKAALQSWAKQLRERYGPSGVGAKDVRWQLGECILCFSFWTSTS